MLGKQIMGILKSISSNMGNMGIMGKLSLMISMLVMLHIQTMGSKVINGRRCRGFKVRRFSYAGFVGKVGLMSSILTEVTHGMLSMGVCLLGVLSEHIIVRFEAVAMGLTVK